MPTVEEALKRHRDGVRIRELREQRGMTVTRLAELVGCSRPHMSNIELGHSPVAPGYRALIAAALGVTLTELEAVAS